MTWQTWSAFAIAETVLCFVPGPAVLFVLSQALSRGTARTVWCILGIIAANTVYFVLLAAGIGAILVASYEVFFAVKWVGVAYLVWLGVTTFFGRSKVLSLSPPADRSVHGGRMLADGFILQMSNPKAPVFFTALLPQFVNPHAPIWLQMLILALTSVAIEFFVQLLYAGLAGRATELATRPRFAALSNRIAGTMLLAVGLGMAALRRA